MKFDYKIDYKALTAAHFTTFTMSPASQETLARNQGRLDRIADNAMEKFRGEAWQKVQNSILGAHINTFA